MSDREESDYCPYCPCPSCASVRIARIKYGETGDVKTPLHETKDTDG